MEIAEDKYGLRSKTIEQICAVLSSFPEVEKAILYGSRAKGNQKPSSDIDLSLYGDKLNLSIQQKIENELDDLLLPYKFDLSIFHHISNEDLIDHIIRRGKEFYKRSSASH